MRPDPTVAAAKTYDYLRLALVSLVVLLFAAVAIEWWRAGRCFQPSISSYYNTPVQAVFVGVLVTMGVCLVALKGSTEAEDVLLNLAGMLAPGVAFVPTQWSTSCRSAPLVNPDIPNNVANNMLALFVTGAIAGVTALVIARKERPATTRRLGTWDRVGLGLAVALLGGGAVWFFVSRSTFLAHGHDFSAIPMFLAIVAVVWVNGRDVEEQTRLDPTVRATKARYVAIYRSISVAMLASLVLVVVGRLVTHWDHGILVVEVLLIALFGAFWVVQTKELWRQGQRPG